MRSARFILFTSILLAGAFMAAFYLSCNKDTCKTVNCQNGKACSGGECQCNTQQTGIGGNNCEVIFEQLYNNSYTGNATRNDSGNYTITDVNNTLTFVPGSDTPFNKMQVLWTDSAMGAVNTPFSLILTTFSTTTGSNFTIGATPFDTFTITGTGNVNTTVASLSLIATHTNGPPVFINMVNFNKKP